MALTRTVREPRQDTAVEREVVNEPVAYRSSGSLFAARLIGFIGGVVLALLALRFIFALLNANPNNGFAHFIYSVTHPLVAPFFTLFNYNYTLGNGSRFETYTLVAMVIYGLIAYGLARLLTLRHPAAVVDREL